MAAIIGGTGMAEPTSEDPVRRRGELGASSHTSFFGSFLQKPKKTFFTGPQHGRLELLEQDFVHGEIHVKQVKQVPAGVVEDLSHVRVRSPPPKQKLVKAPPTVGTQKQSPEAFGGFAAHNHDDPNVKATHLLRHQPTSQWLECMAAHASVGMFGLYIRPRNTRGKQPQPLSSLRPLVDDTLDDSTNGKYARPLDAEKYVGQLPKHQDGMQTFPKHQDGTRKLSQDSNQDAWQKLSTQKYSSQKPSPQKLSPQKLSQLSSPKLGPKWRIRGNMAWSC
jgi:hypothetical protein